MKATYNNNLEECFVISIENVGSSSQKKKKKRRSRFQKFWWHVL